MKKRDLRKALNSLLAFILVLSMMMPFSASASAAEQVKPFKPNAPSESTMQMKAAIAEQLNLLKGGPKLHKDLQGLSGDELVDVIVNLSEIPVGLQKGINELNGKNFSSAEALEVRKKVHAQQNSVKKEMKALQVSYQEGFSYDTVLNGFSAKIKASDLQKLLQVQGVTLVEPDATVYAYEDVASSGQVDAAMNTSIDFLGIEKLWAEGYEGHGIKVAVLDTGIDADHPEFAGIYKGGKNFVPQNNNNYARDRADDDASETSPVDRPAHMPEVNERGSTFWTSHGTHVAGTIAAIGANEYGIKGIAPKVDLYAYRVLGAYGSGSTSGIIAAIDYAVEQEMDVINLSLGGGSNTETASDSYAINNAMMAGTISVIATGNSGPNRGTMGTPATSRLGIAVGNTTNPEASFDGKVTVKAGDFEYSKQLKLMGTTFGADLGMQLNGEYGLVAVPGFGVADDYEGLDVNGKVALVSRGEVPFVDKIAAAKENGAVAIIVHNFAGGTNAPNESGTFLGDDFEFIPTFDMSQTDGDAIRAALEEAEGKISFGNFNTHLTAGDEVNSSSSRGPSTPNFDIKPDVTAPGTNIMSTIPMYKADFPDATYEKAYTRKTGTSMATPHIAGIVALIKQANPEWTPFDVKVALSNTAKILDTNKYDVFSQGAGRVNAYAAAHPEILAYAIDTAVLDSSEEIVENLKGTVTFGPQSIKEEDITVEKQILVRDIAGNGGDYNVTVDYTKTFGDAKISVDKESFTLDGEELLTVTLTASKAEAGAGSELLGYININSANGSVSLPFAVDFSEKVNAGTQIIDMAISKTDLSFNGDGFNDSAELTFTLTGPVLTNYIELWNIMDPEGGFYEDGYIGYLHAGSSLGAGSWRLGISGQYTPWGGTGPESIPDGLYTIDFTALTSTGIIGDFVGPIVVKSTAGTIEGSINGTKVTGHVDDAYIAYQEELVWYGMGYNINTKLKASYDVIKDGEVTTSGPISLAQDGKFSFELPEFDKENETLVVKYEDAAGNKAEAIVTDGGGDPGPNPDEDEITYSISEDILDLTVGESKQLFVTEITTKADGTEVEKDVTEDAIFTSNDESVAIVEAGYVTAVDAGVTHITVTYGDFTAGVKVYVTDNSDVQKLKGTVFTAENSNGELLQSGTVTLYEKSGENGHKRVISKQIKLVEGVYEAFIPDAYILDGMEYYVTLVDDSSKTMYAQEFIGQEEKYYHFSATDLVEMEVETGSFTTDSVNFMLLGMDNSTSVSVNLYDFGWHVSKNAKFLVNWVGTNANNEKYKWFGLVSGDDEFAFDLTNVDWQLLKPSSKYENASLSLYLYGETFSKLYVSEKIIGNPFTHLSVRDGNTTYKGTVPYQKDNKEQEIEFTKYDGYAYHSSNSTTVYTYFENDYGQLDILGANSFTYEIYDENDNRIGEPITTPYYTSFTLKEPLKKGVYKIKLVESTVNEEIVSISMDTAIYVDGQEKPLAIPVELSTKYGKFQPLQLIVQNDDLDSDEYGRTVHLNWNYYEMQFTMPYGFVLNPETQYKIMLTGTIEGNIGVHDYQAMKGEQLLNSSKSNPLLLSEDLKSIKVKHNLNPATIQHAELNFGLAIDGYSPFRPVRVSGKESFQVLASPDSYHGRITIVDNSQNATVLKVPKTTIADDQEIEIEGKDLAKVTIKNMKISGYEYYPNRLILHDESNWVSSITHQKEENSSLWYFLSSKDEYDTPWTYSVRKDVDLNEDKEFIFDKNAISGNIYNFQYHKFGNENYYLQAYVSLFTGDFEITNIYRALEYGPNMMSSEASEDPIRDYVGEFDGLDNVPVEYKIIDSTGKTVWEMTGTLNNGFFDINKELVEGTYTFEVHIPTALRQSITLKEEFTVAGENTPFVQIHSPQSGSITNAESITVIGKANADAEVTLELQKDGTKVNGAVITADAEGAFTHTFHPETDGVYTIVASNEDAKTSVQVTIDRTPPEKASNIEFAKEASGLKVTWTGAEDAVSYKVEVAENDGDFTVLSESQKETTAVITNIKPGVTYNVRITSVDTAGNTSISDVASFTVDEFTATAISLKDGRNADNLLSIGDDLTVTVEGSYETGFTAVANVYVDGKAIEVELAYNETSKLYEGVFTVKEGQKVIEKITGQILNGEEKTEEISNELTWSVGSTVKGLVTDGQPVEDATVRLVSNKTYTVKTDANGAFEVKGLPSGKYKISVLVNGKTYAQQDLEVGQSKIVAAPDYKVPAFTDASITIFDKGTDKLVIDGLSARLTGPKGYIVFGSTVNGKFTTNNGTTVLKGLETGEYKLTVYGQGTYLTTTASINLVKGTTDYKFEVDTLTITEKTLTIKFNGDVEKIDTIYLYSYSTYQKHGYTGVGNYYKYNVKPENGVIVFENVAAADDYRLDIYAEGFISVHQYVDMTYTSEIEIVLDEGRIITGKVTNSQGQPVANAYVYAYGGYTNAYAETDANGEYKLIGLSKTDDIWIDVYSQLYLSHQLTVDKGTDEVKKDIQLAKAVMMTGKVVDRDGQPLANVSISADGKTTYGWGRTATDGSFAVTGLRDTEEYNLSFYSYGYPTVVVENQKPGDIGTFTLQAIGDGDFDGEGNYLAASKASVVSGEEVQFTLAYRNNGAVEAKNVPVTLTIPAGLHLIEGTVTLNGKAVKADGNKVVIPAVAAKASGKITFTAKVGDVQAPTLTVNAKVTEKGSVLTATTSVVFVTLEAPALTGEKKIKVYGNAKAGSTVELFAGNKKVGETKVDGKWWFIDVELPVTDSTVKETFSLSAKVTDGGQSTMSKPITVTYQPDVPKMTDVTVHAGWNGDVKLNPYTGVATFAIVEHTPLDTVVKFDKEVDSASISFLGKKYDLVKGTDNTFTFDGTRLGKWTSYGEQLLEITFIKGNVEVTVPLMNIIVLIDPSGFVFEGSMDNRLEGVQAVVETKVDGEWVQWDAAKFGQVNPQITDEEGRYGWDVIAGEWRVIFTKEGYEPYISRVMNVPPPETELNVPMVRIADPVIKTTEVTADNLTVEFDRLMNTANKSTLIQLFEGDSDTPIEGTVETVDLTGYKSIDTPEDKQAGHIGKDNNEEDGFFEADDSKKLSKTFKFVPKSSLKAGTTYRLVINGQIEDSAGKTLAFEKEFTFTTKSSTPIGGGVYIPPIPPVEPEPKPIKPPVFTDIKNTFAAKEINILATKGIIQGKTETEFAPNAQITRAEFAVLLARALDLPLKEYEGKFSDVNKSKKWAFAGVEAAARAGIVNGTTDGKFNPDAPIKREEIAAMIMRAIEYQDNAKLKGIELPAHFNDHGSIGSFAIDSVYTAAALGIIKGNNGNFNPKNNATRAESAVMLYRALDVLRLLN